ncbi:MAG: MBOAT family O-acyltransferase [Erysipelotrichaceae bacterium]|nr:MBOAT family O-acyltransferase [Erysipelotrichaceae bacterium]
MLFNSLSYAIFLPIVFTLYWLLPHKYRWTLLFVASYYFYMSWNAKYVFLILFTTIISYLSAILIDKYREKKNIILLFTLISCLGVLFVFKYLNFFFDLMTSVFSLFAIKLNTPTLNLLLPVGISFYTFQTLSYVIDVYRGNIQVERHFGYYATFVSFFPQLVAGPIERPENLLPQLKKERYFDYNTATYGMKLMAWGFFKKIVIADNLAVMVDKVYNNLSFYEGFAFVLAAIFFSIEIYCDFSGYSDIAKGSAKLLGIKLMDNFKSPYFSTTVKEFWSKWHISLSSWFKDYVYIPLGGNRCSKPRHYFNLLVTFLISGLWHGANITFVIWGGIHGLLQIIEDIFHIKKEKKQFTLIWFIRVILIFIIMMFAWVFFRAQNIHEALYVIKHMFAGITNPKNYIVSGLYSFDKSAIELLIYLAIYLIPLIGFDIFNMNTDVIAYISKQNIVIRYTIYFVLVLAILFLHYVGEVNFIYFQF